MLSKVWSVSRITYEWVIRFEKWLSDKVFSIIQEHWQNKPVITFCASRKGTVECANQVKKASLRTGCKTLSFFVRNEAQKARLIAAAHNATDNALADMLIYGMAWHNAAMEPADRSLVEQLFISRDVMFLACTATLAQVRGLLLCYQKVYVCDILAY